MTIPDGNDDANGLLSMEQLHQLLAALPRPVQTGPECLSDDAIAALAEGNLEVEARRAAMPHLATCAICRGAVASVARALADPGVAREVAGRTRFGGRHVWRIALPLAAAAALAIILVRPPSVTDQPSHRAPAITAAEAPVPVAPVGRVAAVTTLSWAPAQDADGYRVTVFGFEGRVVYEIELTGTVAVLPDSIRLVPNQPYLWKVEARTGFDRWAASDLVDFSLAPGPR